MCADNNHQLSQMILDEEHNVTRDQACQVNTISDYNYKLDNLYNIIVCNIFKNNDSAVQTDLYDGNINLLNCHVKQKIKLKHKKVGTDKTYVDKIVGPNINFEESSHYILNQDMRRKFEGYKSIKSDEQILGLAGVTRNVFNYLLKHLNNSTNWNIPKYDRLLITLVKLKTGLSFSSIALLFDIHRTTASKVFSSTLQNLVCATKENIFWPAKHTIQKTMPECFKPHHSNVRVIIDCTEFKTETPNSVDNRVFFYSHYKKGYTIKILIGITPCGFISFKSKAAGGRKSDAQITIESGLIDLLEEGDIVLADKGFPEIRTSINESKKSITVQMPPFLRKNSEFTKEEAEETYKIAKVRIHVERIMQRLRIYKILDKIPVTLFKYIDDIIHICCVLVN
ncbi:uncharacterized protein [Prorops nasuta]|uniref:uncharacterized protein n=1 Tax=Prorops nasuta TaxID=863751 RepID=UPI0034CFFD79